MSSFAPILERYELLERRRPSVKEIQREINPLEKKGDNPIKRVASATVKASKSGRQKDYRSALSKTGPAISYAAQHGYPRLGTQLRQHKQKLSQATKPLARAKRIAKRARGVAKRIAKRIKRR